ncbi:hypothetical protein Gobs01_02595 [Geodermatophilus obscurus DSM 43160]
MTGRWAAAAIVRRRVHESLPRPMFAVSVMRYHA